MNRCENQKEERKSFCPSPPKNELTLGSTATREARIETAFAHSIPPTEPCEEAFKAEAVAAMGGGSVSDEGLGIKD